jgi:hypothetical protein
MKCQACNSHAGGMFLDYDRYFQINLCGNCAKEMGYPINNRDNSNKCSCCGEAFIPRGKWQKICTTCWIRTQPKKEKKAVFIFSKEPQQKLNSLEAFYGK